MTRTIRSLNELSATSPTIISADTECNIPGYYIDFDGNTQDCAEPGARWTLRAIDTEARVRDLVIGKAA
jgi:hypothetical protein